MQMQNKKLYYEAPRTKRTRVALESGICASSKEKVVVDNTNATVDIDRQTEGGTFEITTWDE